MSKMIKVFDPNNHKESLNSVALSFHKKYKDLNLTAAYSLLGDAIEEDLNIYRLSKPIKSNQKKLPLFKYL